MKPSITNGDIQNLFLYGHMDAQVVRNANEILVSGYEINEVVTINSSGSSHHKPILFQNCDFNEGFTIMDYTGAMSLKFLNCRFKTDVHASTKNRPLGFSDNCQFEGGLFITSLSQGNFAIENSTVKKTLSLTGDFSENVTLKGINLDNDKSNLVGRLHINSCTFLTASFFESNFDDILINGNSSFKYEADFVHVNTNSFHCSLSKIGLIIRFSGSNILKFRIDNIYDKARKVSISDGCFIGNIDLPLAQFDEFEIVESSIDSLRISGTNSKESSFSVEKTPIRSLIFENVINEGRFSFKEVLVDKNCMISIKSSVLAKTDFILCDFAQAKFEFENSKLTECFLAETDFPKAVLIGGKLNFGQAQLAFGQLSTAFQK